MSNNDVATIDKPKTPLKVLDYAFENMGGQFEDMLPDHVSLSRYRRVCLTAVGNNPLLLSICDTKEGRESILMAALKCASDGLVPDGREAAFVPFKGKVTRDNTTYSIWLAQYMPMVRGIVTRMQQTGSTREIAVNLVYRNELFHYAETHEGVEFRHEPLLFGDKGDLIGAYALIRTLKDGFYIAALDGDDLQKIENTSKAKNGPWNGPFKGEMQKKSALKRLAKIAPVSREVQSILDYDNATFHSLNNTEAIEQKRASPADRLQASIMKPHDTPETPDEDAHSGNVPDGDVIEPEPEPATQQSDAPDDAQTATKGEPNNDTWFDLDEIEAVFAEATSPDALSLDLEAALQMSWVTEESAKEIRALAEVRANELGGAA